MNLKNIFMLLLLLIFVTKIKAISLLSDYKANKAYQKKDFEKALQVLQKEQVDNPKDAGLNYNLGTVYYNLNNLNQAKISFQRSIKAKRSFETRNIIIKLSFLKFWIGDFQSNPARLDF